MKWNPKEYVSKTIMSSHKQLLVEGSDDKIMFTVLLNEISEHNNLSCKIDIDVAEDLISFDTVLGNREKVEYVYEIIKGKPSADKVVCFVDREFRQFEKDTDIKDVLGKHMVDGRLIWSRGHSIENYYFDMSILKDPFKTFTVNEYYNEILEMFHYFLEEFIRLACIVSLAADEIGFLDRIRSNVHWSWFQPLSSSVELDYSCIEKDFIRIGLSHNDVCNFVSSIKRWSEKVLYADFSSIRWLCDGHTGFKFIWASYGRCVFDVCRQHRFSAEESKTQVQKIFTGEERVRFNACVHSWVKAAIKKQCDYPAELLKLLGLTRTA